MPIEDMNSPTRRGTRQQRYIYRCKVHTHRKKSQSQSARHDARHDRPFPIVASFAFPLEMVSWKFARLPWTQDLSPVCRRSPGSPEEPKPKMDEGWSSTRQPHRHRVGAFEYLLLLCFFLSILTRCTDSCMCMRLGLAVCPTFCVVAGCLINGVFLLGGLFYFLFI